MPGPTQQTYTIVADDVGAEISCLVTATNQQGYTDAESNVIVPLTADPVNTVAPTVSGSAIQGETLTLSTGTWVGLPTIAFDYQFQVSDDGSTAWTGLTSLGGETSPDYLITVAEVGKYIRGHVIGSNGEGQGDVYSSNVLGPVTAFNPLTDIPWEAAYTADSIAVSDGAAVAQWDDESGNDYHVAQSVAGSRPLFDEVHASWNNQSVVVFDGVDDYLYSAFDGSAPTQPFALFCVVRMPTSATTTKSILSSNIQSSATFWVLQREESDDGTSPNNWNVYAGTHGWSTVDAGTTPQVIVVHFNGASSYIRVDGVETAVSIGTRKTSGLTMGATGNTQTTHVVPSIYGAGELGFVGVLLRAPEGSEVDGFEGWAADKYGITL